MFPLQILDNQMILGFSQGGGGNISENNFLKNSWSTNKQTNKQKNKQRNEQTNEQTNKWNQIKHTSTQLLQTLQCVQRGGR